MINKEELYADRLNRKLKHASRYRKVGSQEITLRVNPLLLDLSSKDRIPKNENNDYFYMDSSWDGSNYTLWQHVHFKKIPLTEENKKHVQYIEEEGHMSKKNYDKFVDDWHHKSYLTNVKNLSLQNAEILEDVMNSSAAWHLVTTKSSKYDSKQTAVMERWETLYKSVEKALESDQSLFDWVKQAIDNEKRSINYIISAVDEEIRLMAQHGYSRRLKKHY